MLCFALTWHIYNYYKTQKSCKKRKTPEFKNTRTISIWVLLQPDFFLCILFCGLQLSINLQNTMTPFVKCFPILRK